MLHRKQWRLVFTAIASIAFVSLFGAGCDVTSTIPIEEPNPGLELCDASNEARNHAFSAPAIIDNHYLPLTPGMQLILDGEADRGSGVLDHRVIFTVTEVTKVIDGVRTLVVWDRDYNAGELAEQEIAFWAQDDDGNVWNFGEYPEEYEDGEFVGAPDTWLHGLADANAGLHMPKNPQVGAQYLQGWAPDVDFLDCQRIALMEQQTCVPYNCYVNVIITEEWAPFEGPGKQLKYYAPGVGIVQVGAIEDPEAEVLLLVNVIQLTPETLAEANRVALWLDSRAYENAEIYRETQPAEWLPAMTRTAQR
ncbi:MAG: hypothetical protein JSW67_02205 [Candidatus Latescibacterota bacterium]|nr:MAG: hypothetical protein JSW67_02205 [Candidatus Latescibacterota bacterium]